MILPPKESFSQNPALKSYSFTNSFVNHKSLGSPLLLCEGNVAADYDPKDICLRTDAQRLPEKTSRRDRISYDKDLIFSLKEQFPQSKKAEQQCCDPHDHTERSSFDFFNRVGRYRNGQYGAKDQGGR